MGAVELSAGGDGLPTSFTDDDGHFGKALAIQVGAYSCVLRTRGAYGRIHHGRCPQGSGGHTQLLPVPGGGRVDGLG